MGLRANEDLWAGLHQHSLLGNTLAHTRPYEDPTNLALQSHLSTRCHEHVHDRRTHLRCVYFEVLLE